MGVNVGKGVTVRVGVGIDVGLGEGRIIHEVFVVLKFPNEDIPAVNIPVPSGFRAKLIFIP